MNPLLFTVALLGVFALLNMYISKRLIAHLDISTKHKRNFRLFLYINLLGILLYALGRYYINVPGWLYFLFSLPIGILFLLFCTTLVYDISRVILNCIPLSSTRRKFFKRSLDASSFAVASSLSLSAIYEAKHVEVQKVSIKIKNLQTPYKIMQISDTHIGGLIDKEFIKNIVFKANACNPDLVVITGDLVDIDVQKADPILQELKALKAKYGTYYIVGNHEYFHSIEKIIAAVKSLGIKVLENENIYIGEKGQGFNLAGVYDLFGYRAKKYLPDITKALQSIQNSPTVLLAHQPRFLEEVAGGVDLVLSGHTHGGQIYPFRFLVSLQQPYISGLHQHTKDLQIYVNKGTGFWGPPMRLGSSAEITDISIMPA
ncbi:metallophosphoesterase [Sulfurimonas autotrophica]|uniref:Metallophosphoesterase n=1 Tax=Sulfurimonas autotrophica (strain ATCC BAA-671 / DSM 16294 / JCM 11897 / OK10) TaxID=563040 RepID=E0URI9_SULAO|nr:metallophosphoesterase [Sulfurimonas autotrophica]ADN10075.1 metallophosphoesterase [Sulfurimonas autotrophica DSM 16294]